MNTRSPLLFALLLSLLAAHPASAVCPNCAKTSISGRSTSTVTYTKGKAISAATPSAITEVAGSSITVSEAKAAKTYRTDANTRVLINGNNASLERLRKGMRVIVDASLLQPTVARTISATSS